MLSKALWQGLYRPVRVRGATDEFADNGIVEWFAEWPKIVTKESSLYRMTTNYTVAEIFQEFQRNVCLNALETFVICLVL